MLAFGLWGCSEPPPATVATVASATPTAPAAQDQNWFTYFAPDGSFSLQFPKAPQSVGKAPGGEVLAHALDQKGSSLSLISMPLSPETNLEKLFSKPGLKIIKQEKVTRGSHEGTSVEMEADGNRVWVMLFPAKPYLHQLVALQSSKSTQDYGAERAQFFASFQFTETK